MKCPKCGYVFNDTRNEAQRNKFHAVVRDYMSVTGYDFEYAKTELKYLFGIWAELRYSTEKRIVEYYYNTGGVTTTPPQWPGKIVSCYNKDIYMKSESVYTKKEEVALIDFSERAVMEQSI